MSTDPDQHRAAMEACLVALVLALHQQDVLMIDEFLDQLKGSDAFERAALDKPRNEVLDGMIRTFEEMASALRRGSLGSSPID